MVWSKRDFFNMVVACILMAVAANLKEKSNIESALFLAKWFFIP